MLSFLGRRQTLDSRILSNQVVGDKKAPVAATYQFSWRASTLSGLEHYYRKETGRDLALDLDHSFMSIAIPSLAQTLENLIVARVQL